MDLPSSVAGTIKANVQYVLVIMLLATMSVHVINLITRFDLTYAHPKY